MNGHAEFEGIYNHLKDLPVFSDHEHHKPDGFFADGMDLDKVLMNSYVGWTFCPLDGTAEARARLLDRCRFNSYFVWVEAGIKALHNVDEPITMENWGRISDTIAQAHAQDPDLHWRALAQQGYNRLILDAYWDPGSDNGHPEIFDATFRIDKFMYGFHKDVEAPDDFFPWARYGFEGGSLDDYVALMRSIITGRHDAGQVVALKCAEAYKRSVSFLPDDRDAARRVFNSAPHQVTSDDRDLFGNYIFNRCCELAAELDVPFQVHTGLARLAGSQPMNFEPIIARHPNTRFVMFHSGYPWIHEVVGLVHNYPNALPSLTWTVTINTAAAVRALHDYIDVAPDINTITWGSDCWTPEESAGALLAWRHVIARVLADRLADGRLTSRQAESLAEKLSYQNGSYVYPKAKISAA